MKINLTIVPLEAVLLARDYYESEYAEKVELNYVEDSVEVHVEREQLFLDEMHDFVKRLTVLERTRALKEIIVGRALYGLVELN